jgi:hypothetical protein
MDFLMAAIRGARKGGMRKMARVIWPVNQIMGYERRRNSVLITIILYFKVKIAY